MWTRISASHVEFRSSSSNKLSGTRGGIGLTLVSQKSSTHHASNPIITFGLRVNSREPDYQDAKNHHYSGGEMLISHRRSNGPLSGFVCRWRAVVFPLPVALLRLLCRRQGCSSSGTCGDSFRFFSDHFDCGFIPIFGAVAIEADSNLFTSLESFPSLLRIIGQTRRVSCRFTVSLHRGKKKTPQ